MDERLLHDKLDKLLTGVASLSAEMRAVNRRLDDHTSQDERNFNEIQTKLDEVEDDLHQARSTISIMAAKADIVEEIGRKAGRGTATKVAPIVTAIMVAAWETAKAFFGGN